MAKEVVVHTATKGAMDTDLQVGQAFPVLEEPNDFTSVLIFMQLEERNMLDKVVVVDLDDSFIILTLEKDENGRSLHDHFELREVA